MFGNPEMVRHHERYSLIPLPMFVSQWFCPIHLTPYKTLLIPPIY